MNLATLVALAAVVAVTAGAACRVYRMARSNDMCYACPNKGCCGKCSPINCSIRDE